jgi:hypothetical protein
MQATQTTGHPDRKKYAVSMIDNLNEIKEKAMYSFVVVSSAYTVGSA